MNNETSIQKPFSTACGRVYLQADSSYFPSAFHHGRKIIFCTDACLGAFLSAPERFLQAHRKKNEKTQTFQRAE